MKNKLMTRMPLVLIVAAVLWTGGVAQAGHRAYPSPRPAVLESADDLEDAAERLVQVVARESQPRSYRDREALRAVEDLLLRTRQIERELGRPVIDGRQLDRKMDLLVATFDQAARALSQARVSHRVWNRFNQVDNQMERLDDAVRRTLLTRSRTRPPFRRGTRVEAVIGRSIPIGDGGHFDINVTFRR